MKHLHAVCWLAGILSAMVLLMESPWATVILLASLAGGQAVTRAMESQG